MLTRLQQRARDALRADLLRAGPSEGAYVATTALTRGHREHWNWRAVDPFALAIEAGSPRAAAGFVYARVVDMTLTGEWGNGAALRCAVRAALPDIHDAHYPPRDEGGFFMLITAILDLAPRTDVDACAAGGGPTALAIAVRQAAAYVKARSVGWHLRAQSVVQLLLDSGASARRVQWVPGTSPTWGVADLMRSAVERENGREYNE